MDRLTELLEKEGRGELSPGERQELSDLRGRLEEETRADRADPTTPGPGDSEGATPPRPGE
jgi:hypothetical protein